VVRDEGVGIDEGRPGPDLRALRARVSAKGRSGFGLGLWIVRQIVEAMGGSIGVESQLGAGSTFTVPLRSPARAPLRTQPQGPQ
jgi:signal transduction histidine kinase